MNEHRVLFVGLGDLGSQIFDLLVRLPTRISFLVGGRNLEYLKQRTNLSLFAATQLGLNPDVSCTYIDLWNREQTAETISRFQPSIIFCAATLQRTEAMHNLSTSIAEQLAEAQLGPRLPLHLALVYRLMQSLQMTGLKATVLNAVYPDVVGPILHQVGLAPTTGIGDLANNVPALRMSIAAHLDRPVEQIDIRLVMARYVSYRMSRFLIEDEPFSLTTLINGEELLHPLQLKPVLDLLLTRFKRMGGITGLVMTAASASLIFNDIVNNTGLTTHAPGPNGLPGGYPVKVNSKGVEIVLPSHLSLEVAIETNRRGLYLDGIEKIDSDGTVYFVEKNMSIFKRLFGYECKRMPLMEAADWAEELQARYAAFADKHT